VAAHYVENDELWRYPQPAFQFGRPWTFAGHTYTGAWLREGGKNDPPSGMSPVSFWPYEADLIAMVNTLGTPGSRFWGKISRTTHPISRSLLKRDRSQKKAALAAALGGASV
jgi:hypothetical protein